MIPAGVDISLLGTAAASVNFVLSETLALDDFDALIIGIQAALFVEFEAAGKFMKTHSLEI